MELDKEGLALARVMHEMEERGLGYTTKGLEHAENSLLARVPSGTSVLCTHPMFGPESGRHGWENLAFVYDRVRVRDDRSETCERFLSIFESAGCKMVEMTCTQHDVYAANSQFLTQLQEPTRWSVSLFPALNAIMCLPLQIPSYIASYLWLIP